MSPFQPRGSRALRVIVVDLAANRERGELITYGELAEAIDVTEDDAGRAQVRQAVSAARPLLLQDYKKALVPVRGKGYRVALAGEHAEIAQVHRRKSDRQISRALAVINHTDEAALTPDELRRHQAVGVLIRNLHSRMTSAEQRLADLETAVFGPPRAVLPGKVET